IRDPPVNELLPEQELLPLMLKQDSNRSMLSAISGNELAQANGHYESIQHINGGIDARIESLHREYDKEKQKLQSLEKKKFFSEAVAKGHPDLQTREEKKSEVLMLKEQI